MTSLRTEFHNRYDLFCNSYDYLEAEEVLRSLSRTGELVEALFSKEHADVVMALVMDVVERTNPSSAKETVAKSLEGPLNWREQWEDPQVHEVAGHLGFDAYIADMRVFADFGILPIWGAVGKLDALGDEFPEERDQIAEQVNAAKDPVKWIEDACEKVERLEHIVGASMNGEGRLVHTSALRQKVKARLKFDAGSPLTVHELALLSGVSLKRLQNAIYAQSEGAPTPSKAGLISPEGCARWLFDRDYYRSLWKEIVAEYPLSTDWGEDVEIEANETSLEHDDYIFVPLDKDGEPFRPSLGKGDNSDRYTIGPKGAEEQVSGFEEALKKLTRMEVAKWRRPNPESGNWGLVSAKSWKRVRRSELA